MGHIHLGVLPQSKRWRDVVGLLTEGAGDAEVIAASARAAERDLLQATQNPVYVEAVRLLLSIPLAARFPDFGQALRNLDLAVGASPDLLEITAAVTERLDRLARGSNQSPDFAELATRALTASLSQTIGAGLPGLFEATPADVQAMARKLSGSKGIAELTRAYFGSLLSGTLSYWLDRTLAQQIGGDGRFQSARERSAFDAGLRQYTSEATRIIQEFAGGWYGKTIYENGAIDSDAATVFGAVALKKIVSELQRRYDVDA